MAFIDLNVSGSPANLSPKVLLQRIALEVESYQLCGFCDVSTTAYAAVVYLLMRTEAEHQVKFVASKTRWRWRNEDLQELRECHRHSTGNPKVTSVSIEDVVIVHNKDRLGVSGDWQW